MLIINIKKSKKKYSTYDIHCKGAFYSDYDTCTVLVMMQSFCHNNSVILPLSDCVLCQLTTPDSLSLNDSISHALLCLSLKVILCWQHIRFCDVIYSWSHNNNDFDDDNDLIWCDIQKISWFRKSACLCGHEIMPFCRRRRRCLTKQGQRTSQLELTTS